MGDPADGAVAKAAHGVSVGVELAGRLGRVLRVQQATFLDR